VLLEETAEVFGRLPKTSFVHRTAISAIHRARTAGVGWAGMGSSLRRAIRVSPEGNEGMAADEQEPLPPPSPPNYRPEGFSLETKTGLSNIPGMADMALVKSLGLSDADSQAMVLMARGRAAFEHARRHDDETKIWISEATAAARDSNWLQAVDSLSHALNRPSKLGLDASDHCSSNSSSTSADDAHDCGGDPLEGKRSRAALDSKLRDWMGEGHHLTEQLLPTQLPGLRRPAPPQYSTLWAQPAPPALSSPKSCLRRPGAAKSTLQNLGFSNLAGSRRADANVRLRALKHATSSCLKPRSITPSTLPGSSRPSSQNSWNTSSGAPALPKLSDETCSIDTETMS